MKGQANNKIHHTHTFPQKYAAKEQFVKEYNSSSGTKADQKHLQRVIGEFLWYAQAVDPMILTALSTLTSQQGKPAH